jgi:hypothetical protein
MSMPRLVRPKIGLRRRESPWKSASWIFEGVFPILTLFGGLNTLKNPKTGSKIGKQPSKAENKGQKTTE